jgi:glycosyltransferase involved in cell wall biosynthesis
MFSGEELLRRDATYRSQIENSDLVIVSSEDAHNDLRTFAPEHASKARVLHFVAQLSPAAHGTANAGEIEAKYGFRGKFFYIPNQFWKHKNHKVVFEAVRILKERHREILVLCSGQLEDFRNVGHIRDLRDYLDQYALGENIRLLGLIDFADLGYLMRNCISVINPSFFEGWSTTVEEAKTLGKNLILSDIPVHREQAPPKSCYFDPRDPEALAAILAERWETSSGGPDHDLEEIARNSLRERTERFGLTYEEIALEAVACAKKAPPPGRSR